MMYRKIAVSLLICLGILMAGCGEAKVNNTTLSISSKGEVTQNIIEPFSAEDGSLDELKSMVLSEIAGFAGEGKEAISLKKIEQQEANVHLLMTYPSVESFSSFENGKVDSSDLATCFYGTVEQAFQDGLVGTVTLYEDGDQTKSFINTDTLKTRGDSHVFIYDNALNNSLPITISLPHKIAYATEGIIVDGKNAYIEKEAGTLIMIVTK
ncbi:MAG: hypothetical protein K6E48_05735 [Lachnospiraceae bacterium]|nr:hypothetical protein [Lachnospiraceae bacterium]